MAKRPKQRGLSPEFMTDMTLPNGMLKPLLERVQSDTSLQMDIRSDCVNVYYRGGNLLRVKRPQDSVYRFTFDTKYVPETLRSSMKFPDATVESKEQTQEWIRKIPLIKDTMDLWFGKHPKDERALQQLVAWENNSSPWAGSTDYFIVDIEYANREGARFDLVALRWDSTASARRLSKGYRPRLTIIEMKSGDGAVKGNSGMAAHLKQLQVFLGRTDKVAMFKKEMLNVFKQKRELGLIKSLRGNGNEVKDFDASVDVLFLLAGHDPESARLSGELSGIEQACSVENPIFPIGFCTANFMGFALYNQNIHSLGEFRRWWDKAI